MTTIKGLHCKFVFISDVRGDRELSLEERKLIDMGRQDATAQVIVTITVHTTPEFR
jgi:hypothetical protein